MIRPAHLRPLSCLGCAIMEAARQIAEMPPPAPCGSKESPHIVSPGGKHGDLRRCVRCGEIGALP